MRLIDADRLKKTIWKYINEKKDFWADEKTVCEMIDQEPTAYDVEAVCRKLFMESEGVCGYEMVLLDSADEIIRSGGI